jgi:hypothetical protein
VQRFSRLLEKIVAGLDVVLLIRELAQPKLVKAGAWVVGKALPRPIRSGGMQCSIRPK